MANSVPKSGTHLLTRLLVLLGLQPADDIGIRSHLVAGRYGRAKRLLRAHRSEQVTVGVVSPQRVDRGWLARQLDKVDEGRFVVAHCLHTPEMADLLREKHMRVVCIVRDPRDVAVSQMHHIQQMRDHFAHDAFASLRSDDDRLLLSIRGGRVGNRELLSLDERYRRFLGWRDDPDAIVVRFEDLVGPEGGGDADAQRHTIVDVARHLDLAADPVAVADVAKALFGQGRTFRKGQVAGWRDVFSDVHRRAAEDVVGGLLVELGYEPPRAV